MKSDSEVPVALFVFNRSEQLIKTLEGLKKNSISQLYVFADGPRNESDLENINNVRALIDEIDWVKVTKIYQKENKGLSESIRAGLNHIFKTHDRVIVVEDDIYVNSSFYKYMKAGLEHFANNPEVACITGFRYPFDRGSLKQYPYDAFFTQRFCSWGWATWKRYWQTVEFDREKLKKNFASKDLSQFTKAGEDMPIMIEQIISGVVYGGWDINCAATILLNNQFVLWPVYNMVQNTGLTSGTHGGQAPSWKSRWEKPRQKGDFLFPTEIKTEAEILSPFLAFFHSLMNPTSGLLTKFKKTVSNLKTFKRN